MSRESPNDSNDNSKYKIGIAFRHVFWKKIFVPSIIIIMERLNRNAILVGHIDVTVDKMMFDNMILSKAIRNNTNVK